MKLIGGRIGVARETIAAPGAMRTMLAWPSDVFALTGFNKAQPTILKGSGANLWLC